MIKVFALKPFTGNPADGIDNVNAGIFGNLSDGEINYFVEMPDNLSEVGSIRRIYIKNKTCLLRPILKVVLIRKIKPDYLLGRGSLGEIFFVLLKPRKTKYVIGWHTLLLKKSGAWKVRTPWFLRKAVFSLSDLIIAVSLFSAESVKRFFPQKKIYGIVNGVDVNFFNPNKKNGTYLEKKYNIHFSKPIISFVGTLQPRKRPDLVLSLAQSMPEVNFVFVGRDFPPWHFGENIKNVRNALWIPSMSREDVAILLASSDIFVFPSLEETCAAVIVEAMASGIPSVVSQSGGNIEMVRDGIDGFLISQADEKKNFLEKIDKILGDEFLKATLGENARKRAENDFSWKMVAQKYMEILISNV